MKKLTFTDINNAFEKLQSYIYFDNNDLQLRHKFAEFKENFSNDNKSEIIKKILIGDFEEELNSISLRLYPKKIESKSQSDFDIPSNFYTNEFVKKNSEVKRLTIFIDAPIVLHLISVLWILKYGVFLEKGLSDSAYGNRLLINEDNENGRTLYKPYQHQYQKWWGEALKKTKELLDNKDNATIVNIDFKDFYHRVRFNFKDVEIFLEEKCPDFSKNNKIHIIFKKIHEIYKMKLVELSHESIKNIATSEFPLPVTLISSHILANWYLCNFDKKITDELNPQFYGRYVDDILIVFKDTLLNKNRIPTSENCLNLFDYYLSKYFNTFFETIDKETIQVKSPYKNLLLQKEKVFIYQFNHELSPNLINKFVEDQKERIYEFSFLSDDADENFGDFEENTFEANFDSNDINKAKLRNIEDNRFKLSVFLAKLIQRRILNGNEYKQKEINKIEKYFKGIFLLKNFYFWEKLFSLYVVCNERQKFFNLIYLIHEEIDSLEINKKIIGIDLETISGKRTFLNNITKKTKDQLRDHLRYSIKMALGLFPGFLNKDQKQSHKYLPYFSKKEESVKYYIINKYSSAFSQEISYYNTVSIFRRNSLLRKQFVWYPLTQYVLDIKNSACSLFDYNLYNNLEKSNILKLDDGWKIPHRIKFYESALFTIYSHLYLDTQQITATHKEWYNDLLPSYEILEEAFTTFCSINGIVNQNQIKSEYFKSFPELTQINENELTCDSNRIQISRSKNYFTNQILLKNGGKNRDKIRIAIVNKYVGIDNLTKSLIGIPVITSQRIQEFNWILDEVSKVKNCDLFVQPELSLPHSLIYHYTRVSSNKQIGFITGIEHFKIRNIAYNFILTVLPIKLNNYELDAIPIIRLKNHYAPEEVQKVNDKKLIVPKPNPYRYDLFNWRGVYFSAYYCFELADIYHRAAFFGKLDFVCAPVWNKDTIYYNNIVEASTRDMHCYFIEVNTSQYGESRISRPTSNERKDKSRVKGGTVDDYPVTLLVSDIDIKSIRNFQSIDYSEQKELNNFFKPTPPDFPQEDLEIRNQNKKFPLESYEFIKNKVKLVKGKKLMKNKKS